MTKWLNDWLEIYFIEEDKSSSHIEKWKKNMSGD